MAAWSKAIDRGGSAARVFWVYAALLVLVPAVWAQVAFNACVNDEAASVEESDGGTGDSLCGLAYLVIPPLAVAVVLAVCAAYELVVRAALRRRGSAGTLEAAWPRRYWFEVGVGVLALLGLTGGTLAVLQPWDEEPRQVPEYRQVLARAEAHREPVVPVVAKSRRRWPAADATYAQAEAMTGPGNHRLQPLFRDINFYDRANLRRLRCLYWPVVDEVSDDIADSRSLIEKCWPKSRPAASESSLSYASLFDDPDD